MQIFLFLALLISAMAILFAVQNTETATIRFLFWQLNGALALVILIALSAGALASVLASLPGRVRDKLTIRNQRKKMTDLENQIKDQKSKLEEVEKRLQEQQKAENGLVQVEKQ